MTLIGILGGMGPAATVDFIDKLVKLTPAQCDQEHLPLLVASLPHTPDRSHAILAEGADPLPALLAGVDLLNRNEVGLIVIPCNTSHHWFGPLAALSKAPVLHIAKATVASLAAPVGSRVAVLATRGTLASGFYQRELTECGYEAVVPPADREQTWVDEAIRAVKSADVPSAEIRMEKVLSSLQRNQAISAAILACTELPIAVRQGSSGRVFLLDSSRCLAEATVKYGLQMGWNRSAKA